MFTRSLGAKPAPIASPPQRCLRRLCTALATHIVRVSCTSDHPDGVGPICQRHLDRMSTGKDRHFCNPGTGTISVVAVYPLHR
jgi:hypothetical protein